ncbi:MAG: hypothetical protein ACKVOR_09370 [Flavobacteriales bacterium]
MRLLLFTLPVIATTASCNIINPDEGVPAYIKVESVSVQTFADEGTSSSKISEAWLYVNDNMNGAFSIPASAPVIGEGNTRITCFAGIKNNGIGSLRLRYPFYAGFDTVVNLQPQVEIAIQPHFEYVSGLDIDTSRDFESKSSFLNVTAKDVEMDITIDGEIVKEGNGSGHVHLDDGEDYFQLVDNSPIIFTAGNTVFLEMDYSCNNSFTVGCYGIDGPNSNKIGILTLAPTTSATTEAAWNKVYIDLGALGLINAGTDYYKIYLEGARYESSQPHIYLDNLKIVMFEE